LPAREVKATLNLTTDEEGELVRVLNCDINTLNDVLAPYASAALTEYVMMFLGQKVFTRGSDIRTYRLLLLIQQALSNYIADEARVSRLFQTSTSESRALLRAVMSKYQAQIHLAAEQSIRDVLDNANLDPEGGPALITVDNTIIVEHLNRALAEIDGTLEKVARHDKSVSTYEIKPASYEKLRARFPTQAPGPRTRGKRSSRS